MRSTVSFSTVLIRKVENFPVICSSVISSHVCHYHSNNAKITAERAHHLEHASNTENNISSSNVNDINISNCNSNNNSSNTNDISSSGSNAGYVNVPVPVNPNSLHDLTARVYFEKPLVGLGVHPFAVGKVSSFSPSSLEGVIDLGHMHLSPIAEVSSRVFVKVGWTAHAPGLVIGGIVAKVNSNGTLGILLDNNTYESQVKQEDLCVVQSRSMFIHDRAYHEMLEWIRDAGVRRNADRERLCTTLYHRGWREHNLYMLEPGDVHCMTYIRKSVRQVMLEKAEWQRIHHQEMRALLRERVKEREWRYFVQKFSGFVSANWAGLGVLSVFLWQFKNYRKHQRAYQMKYAVNTLTHTAPDKHSSYGFTPMHTMKSALSHKNSVESSSSSSSSSSTWTYSLMETILSQWDHLLEYTPFSSSTREGNKHERSNVPNSYHHVDNYHNRTKNVNLATPSSTQHEQQQQQQQHRNRFIKHSLSSSSSSSPASSSSSSSLSSSELELEEHFVERTNEENWARQILRQLNIHHPRIAVLTGFSGCGKSVLFRTAVRKERKPALFVEVRGSDDTLSCIMKSMKVPSVEACGDYLDFITDAFEKSTAINGEPPIVVITLREGSELSRVYNETVVLACDRMLCHLVFEVSMESLTMSNINLPRVDFYHVPNFTLQQAMQYSEHNLDPLAMLHFIEVVGTNSNDIDELLAAVHHRRVRPSEYVNQKLTRAMRQVQNAWSHSTLVHDALKKLAVAEFIEGQHTGADISALRDPALEEIVLYDPVQDRWVFTHKVLHSAVRCLLEEKQK